MTVVAYDGTSLAVDRLCDSESSGVYEVSKLQHAWGRPYAWAMTGPEVCYPLVKSAVKKFTNQYQAKLWALQEVSNELQTATKKISDHRFFEALLVYRLEDGPEKDASHMLFRIAPGFGIQELKSSVPFAIGHGGICAIGAMMAGVSAKKAVRIALSVCYGIPMDKSEKLVDSVTVSMLLPVK